jgi:hypothetical protein
LELAASAPFARSDLANSKSDVHKVRVLIINPPALSQVIRHLIRRRPEFEIVGCLDSLKRLEAESERLAPELIVANVKPVSAGIGAAVLAIRHASPTSKVLLLCPTAELSEIGRRSGADACLNEEHLVSRLLPVVSALCAPKAKRVSDNHILIGEII